jgi:DNA polymerase-3 subunit delta
MKYQNVQAFEKHLQEAFPEHLSRVYMVVGPCDFERKRLIERIVEVIKRKEADLSTVSYQTSNVALSQVFEQLNTRPMLGGQAMVILEEIEKLKKNDCEALAEYLARPSPFAYLILGGASLKGLGELYQKGKKELVLLDLSEEKPWDRERRLKEGLAWQASKAGKQLKADVAAYLLEWIGPDVPSLEQELSKLLCYVGERQKIELDDVRAISSSREKSGGWHLAESLVWTGASSPPPSDLSSLFALIGQIRYHLELGAQFQALLELGVPPQEIATHLPQVRSASFDKFFPIARQKPSGYFQRGLSLLFELELGCKNSAGDPLLLFDLFTAKLRQHVITTA